MWYPKQENTVETYSLSSEFVATNQSTEMLKGLKYKLWMFGIEILENEAKCFGDNNAVILNLSVLELILKKKHHSIHL